MKILFICQGNIWRSQIAEAFINHYKIHQAISAWIDDVGFKYNYKPYEPVIEIMQAEFNIDMSNQKVKQLSVDSLVGIDKVIVLCSQEECYNKIPDYILSFNNLEFKYMTDPNQLWIKNIKKVIDDIKQMVVLI